MQFENNKLAKILVCGVDEIKDMVLHVLLSDCKGKVSSIILIDEAINNNVGNKKVLPEYFWFLVLYIYN